MKRDRKYELKREYFSQALDRLHVLFYDFDQI